MDRLFRGLSAFMLQCTPITLKSFPFMQNIMGPYGGRV
jgi:hypothetical protein